jgi:hypothetical protein
MLLFGDVLGFVVPTVLRRTGRIARSCHIGYNDNDNDDDDDDRSTTETELTNTVDASGDDSNDKVSILSAAMFEQKQHRTTK